jgi:hypothetical protein
LEWIARKIDTLLAAVVIALAAVAASQSQAFIVQYTQRLGGHLDEARAHLSQVQTGLRYRLMSDTVRGELETDAKHRTAELQAAYDSIAKANSFAKPVALIRHADPTMLRGTWRDFVPALPLTPESFVYVLVGMLLGFIVYEVVKAPFALVLSPRRRKFRKRG